MTRPVQKPETFRPINEDAVANNPDFIEMVKSAKLSGTVMTPDEFKAWLAGQ